MSPNRLTPFDLVFEQVAQDAFPKIRAALDRGSHAPLDRDQFLMVREVVTLLRDLRPDQGLGEGIDQLAALVHHAYLFWDAGRITIELSLERLTDLLTTSPGPEPADSPPAFYAQIPERRVWAQVVPGQPHEPLDGCFVHSVPDATALRVLGIFGVHPEREGFSVVETAGLRPAALTREDGTVLFAPTLPGGAAARLFSIAGEEELLDLGWRIRAVTGEVPVGASRWRA